MRIKRAKISLFLFGLVSLLAHLAALYALARIGSYSFTAPIATGFMVELPSIQSKTLFSGTAAPEHPRRVNRSFANGAGDRSPAAESAAKGGHLPTQKEELRQAPFAEEKDVALEQHHLPLAGGAVDKIAEPKDAAEAVSLQKTKPSEEAASAQHRRAAQYLTATWERLTYRISLFGVPVGSAVLEARNEVGDLRITFSVRSNPVTASFYRVENFAETRLMAGGYLIARIQQQEGTYLSDTGFTLCLRERMVFWIDHLRNQTMTQPLDDVEATDTLSAFYFLRKQPLEVGDTVHLRIFDSNRSVLTPVEVLRKERVTLPWLREVEALVVRPALQTEGLFKRTGDLLIWLTDDQYRVPVRLESSIPLGAVRAELVSAETDTDGENIKPPSSTPR